MREGEDMDRCLKFENQRNAQKIENIAIFDKK